MKPGDLVQARDRHAAIGIEYGVGIIIDTYESDDGIAYYEIVWQLEPETSWWTKEELFLVSKS